VRFFTLRDLLRLRYRSEPLVEVLGRLAAEMGAGPR
jgi:hypothetical protein